VTPSRGVRAPAPPTGGARGALRVLRFDRVQRAAHWANATLFFVLLLTALPLYFPSVERVVGRHVLVAAIHLWAGVAFPVPLLVSVVGPWGARMRRDIRRFNRWTRLELRWLWTLGGVRGLEKDKFNPGQKLNAVFTAGAMALLLGTGIVMKWFGLFPVSWRTGATFVHEVVAFVLVAVVAGHVVMALTHRESLMSMVRGWISVRWAREHAPRWLREEMGATTLPPDRASHARGLPRATVPGAPATGRDP
jgi:formate dehydrogenase subunit gamma